MFDDLRSQVSPFDEDDAPTSQSPRAPSKTAGATASRTATVRSATARSTSAAAVPIHTGAAGAKRIVRKKKKAPSETPLLGLTAIQRFVVSIMMFMLVAVFGIAVLLFRGAVVLPG